MKLVSILGNGIPYLRQDFLEPDVSVMQEISIIMNYQFTGTKILQTITNSKKSCPVLKFVPLQHF